MPITDTDAGCLCPFTQPQSVTYCLTTKSASFTSQ